MSETPSIASEDRALLLQAWVDNRMERDRTLVALSAGGLALLAGMLSAGKTPSSAMAILYSAAALSFVVAMLFGLLVFHRNAAYVEAILKTGSANSRAVDRATTGLVTAFAAGILLTLGVTFGLAFGQTKEEQAMSREIERKIDPGPMERRGLGGLGDLVRPAGSGSPTPAGAPTPSGGGSSTPGSGTPDKTPGQR
jgi:hypothetical protein